MKPFKWSHEKNQWLLETRGILFEDIEVAVHSGCLVRFLKHPNPARYPRQSMLLVRLHDYIWVVPYIEEDDCFFLKTAFASRKATREYLRSDDERH